MSRIQLPLILLLNEIITLLAGVLIFIVGAAIAETQGNAGYSSLYLSLAVPGVLFSTVIGSAVSFFSSVTILRVSSILSLVLSSFLIDVEMSLAVVMGIAFIFSILSQARSIAFFSICSCNVPDQQQTIFQGKIVSLNSLVRITTPAIALFLSNGISAGDLLVLFSTINVIVAVALYWSTLNLVRESSGNILVSIVTHLPKGYPWKALFITYYRCVQTIIVTTVSAEWLLLDNYQQASFNFVLMGVAVTMVGVLMVYNCRNIPEIPVLVIYSLLLVLFLVLKANAWLVFVTLFLYTLYESILASKIKIMATPDDAPYFASWFQWSTGMGMIIGYVAVIINPDFFQTGNLFFILPVAVAGCLIAVILRTESFRIS